MDSQENVLQNEEQLEEKKVEETVVNDTLAKVEEAVEEPATETAEQEPETDNVESMESLPQETSEADNQPVAEVENPVVEEEQPAEENREHQRNRRFTRLRLRLSKGSRNLPMEKNPQPRKKWTC